MEEDGGDELVCGEERECEDELNLREEETHECAISKRKPAAERHLSNKRRRLSVVEEIIDRNLAMF